MSNIDFIKNNFIGSYLIGFGVVAQFIELTFDNKDYKKILINMDCKISSINKTFEDEVNMFNKYSQDVFPIAYFIGVNSKRVKGFELSEGKESVIIRFEGDIDLLFDFSEDETDLAISFWQKNGPTIYFELVNGYIDKSTDIS